MGDVKCTLNWEGGNFFEGHYVLLVGETMFEELPKSKEIVEAPEIAHSMKDAEKHSSPHVDRLDWLVFLKGKPTPVSIEHTKRMKHVSLDICGKPVMAWQDA